MSSENEDDDCYVCPTLLYSAAISRAYYLISTSSDDQIVHTSSAPDPIQSINHSSNTKTNHVPTAIDICAPTDEECGLASLVETAWSAVEKPFKPLCQWLYDSSNLNVISGFDRATNAQTIAYFINILRAENNARAILIITRTDTTAKIWHTEFRKVMDDFPVNLFGIAARKKDTCFQQLSKMTNPGIILTPEKAVKICHHLSGITGLRNALNQNPFLNCFDVVISEVFGADGWLNSDYSPFRMFVDKQTRYATVVDCLDEKKKKSGFNADVVSRFLDSNSSSLDPKQKDVNALWCCPATLKRKRKEKQKEQKTYHSKQTGHNITLSKSDQVTKPITVPSTNLNSRPDRATENPIKNIVHDNSSKLSSPRRKVLIGDSNKDKNKSHRHVMKAQNNLSLTPPTSKETAKNKKRPSKTSTTTSKPSQILSGGSSITSRERITKEKVNICGPKSPSKRRKDPSPSTSAEDWLTPPSLGRSSSIDLESEEWLTPRNSIGKEIDTSMNPNELQICVTPMIAEPETDELQLRITPIIERGKKKTRRKLRHSGNRRRSKQEDDNNTILSTLGEQKTAKIAINETTLTPSQHPKSLSRVVHSPGSIHASQVNDRFRDSNLGNLRADGKEERPDGNDPHFSTLSGHLSTRERLSAIPLSNSQKRRRRRSSKRQGKSADTLQIEQPRSSIMRLPSAEKNDTEQKQLERNRRASVGMLPSDASRRGNPAMKRISSIPKFSQLKESDISKDVKNNKASRTPRKKLDKMLSMSTREDDSNNLVSLGLRLEDEMDANPKRVDVTPHEPDTEVYQSVNTINLRTQKPFAKKRCSLPEQNGQHQVATSNKKDKHLEYALQRNACNPASKEERQGFRVTNIAPRSWRLDNDGEQVQMRNRSTAYQNSESVGKQNVRNGDKLRQRRALDSANISILNQTTKRDSSTHVGTSQPTRQKVMDDEVILISDDEDICRGVGASAEALPSHNATRPKIRSNNEKPQTRDRYTPKKTRSRNKSKRTSTVSQERHDQVDQRSGAKDSCSSGYLANIRKLHPHPSRLTDDERVRYQLLLTKAKQAEKRGSAGHRDAIGFYTECLDIYDGDDVVRDRLLALATKTGVVKPSDYRSKKSTANVRSADQSRGVTKFKRRRRRNRCSAGASNSPVGKSVQSSEVIVID